MTLTAAESVKAVDEALASGLSAAVATVVDGQPRTLGRRIVVTGEAGRASTPTALGTLGDPELDQRVIQVLKAALENGGGSRGGRLSGEQRGRLPGVSSMETQDGSIALYIELHHPPPELIVVGAGHISVPLARVGVLLGFEVTVLDDRPEFASSERFPREVRVRRVDFDRPFEGVGLHSRAHVVLVTRGHRYDYACLTEALRADPALAYIGMIGSRRRVRATYLQLIADGISPDRLEEIHAPVGLDIRAETPGEIAVAVAAELILVRRGGTGKPLHTVERIPERFFRD